MQKVVSLALALILAIGCLSMVACKGKKEDASTSGDGPAVSQEEESPDGEESAPDDDTDESDPEDVDAGSAEEGSPSDGEDDDDDAPEDADDDSSGSSASANGNGVAAFTWDDIPVYPGAEEDDEAMSVATAGSDGVRMEWRQYTTTDSFDQVVAYYRSEMPKNGWEQAVWTDRQPTNEDWLMQGGVFAKNDHHDQATVEITDQADGMTYIALMRVSDDEEAAPAASSGGAAASSGELTWDDVPTYPGVETDESLWTTQQAGDGVQMETRAYMTSDAADQVAAFYKVEMISMGWAQVMWTSSGELEHGVFSKGSEQNIAQIMITDVADQGSQIQVSRILEME